jgi:hypothetical protein
LSTVIAFIDGLSPEEFLILVVHISMWFYCANVVWNMSNMPPSEISDIRSRYFSLNITRRPLVLSANLLWRRLLREASLLLCFWALTSNYFHGHKSWVVAIVFLGVATLGVEVLNQFNRRRYRQDLDFCDRVLQTSRSF